MKERVVFISPHLDDAVFSCGGLMAAMANQCDIHLLTCFTASMPDPSGFALACQTDKGLPDNVDYMAIRRKEDLRACHILGAETLWLNLPEAPHRGYHSAQELFGSKKHQDWVAKVLLTKLRAVFGELRPDIVFYPLGIGNHIDHIQVIQTMKMIEATATNTTFWQWYDEPYLSKNPKQWPGSQHLTHLEANKLPEALQQTEIIAVNIDEYLDQKMQACAAYETQLNFQFGGKNQIQKTMAKKGYPSSEQVEFIRDTTF